MKVIHIIKKIETIDDDIKELRKLEKSLQRDKSFSTPIYMSIEKQINILLGLRIKYLELQISNPPPELVKEIEGDQPETVTPGKSSVKKAKPKKAKSKLKTVKKTSEDNIGIMTQDFVDAKFEKLKEENERELEAEADKNLEAEDNEDLKDNDDLKNNDDIKDNDEDIKLLDVALENGTLNKSLVDKEKRKVKFFKDNFPGGDY